MESNHVIIIPLSIEEANEGSVNLDVMPIRIIYSKEDITANDISKAVAKKLGLPANNEV
jgi:hypothetical protein